MGSISTCEHPDAGKTNINTEQPNDFDAKHQVLEPSAYSNAKSIKNQMILKKKSNGQSIIQQAINANLLSVDNYAVYAFDSKLFYCWVTGEIEDVSSSKFKFNLHIIDKQGQKGCYAFSSNYTTIQQIYSSAYSCRKAYFPQSKFSDQFMEDHKNDTDLTLVQRHMMLYEILWTEVTEHTQHTMLDVQTCCDALIKLLNAPLLVQQKSNILFRLGMQLEIKNLLQNIARQWIASLTQRAKADVGEFTTNNQLIHWSHLTFHTLSLAERPNNATSTHWALKFEGDNYLLSLDLFNEEVVNCNDAIEDIEVIYYQILSNDAIGQRIAWYSWIKQTEFIHHWSERVRVPLSKPVSFHVIGCLVWKWKEIYNKYHVFDNNCQHFARDLLSVFALNAAKKLTDETQNIFLTANMTLTKELERIDLVSNTLKKQLNVDNDKIKNDEMYKWLLQIGLPQYFHMFKQHGITLNLLHNNTNAIAILETIVFDEKHICTFIKNIHAKYEDNWNGVQLFLADLDLNDYESVVDKFEEQKINDMTTLCELNDSILKTEIGIVLGNRSKIMSAIK